MRKIDLFRDYENAKLTKAHEFVLRRKSQTYYFDEIESCDIDGIPICVTRDNGRLSATFIPDTHVLAIGATRSGKTTGYVIPTMNILLKKKNKPSLVVSDPKLELYYSNAKKFEKQGYQVILLDFNNYAHSDCWNPLTKYYRLYREQTKAAYQIKTINLEDGRKVYEFRGERYETWDEVLAGLETFKECCMDEVEKGISAIAMTVVPKSQANDPFWDDSARDLFCAIIYGMLEDTVDGTVTEETFSFDTVIRILDSFSDSERDYDGGYFTHRSLETSKARRIAQKCILEQANNTRRCIASAFATKMNKFRDTCVRKITSRNTFEIEKLDGKKPTVIFLSYKDEEALHYDIISMFLTNLYTGLIEVARKKSSKLDRPFYFLLDEFGNLPKFNDFDKVISACGGRNIWFLLILQSYAQLYHVYGKEIAEIIKDNLNTHIFFGTNNPETKKEFSEECGKKTILSPISALNGGGELVERFEKDTVALVPVSALTHIEEGECIVTQMRDDVLLSRIERSYMCPEFAADCERADERVPVCNFLDKRYIYVPKKYKRTFASDFAN